MFSYSGMADQQPDGKENGAANNNFKIFTYSILLIICINYSHRFSLICRDLVPQLL